MLKFGNAIPCNNIKITNNGCLHCAVEQAYTFDLFGHIEFHRSGRAAKSQVIPAHFQQGGEGAVQTLPVIVLQIIPPDRFLSEAVV